MKKRILCIDDDPLIRDVFTDFLEKAGFDVETAADGPAGVDAFCKMVPDLVLCDLRMPGVDGLKVVSELHKMDTGVPIVVVSGTALIHDAVEALKNGAWDFVTKPIRDLGVLSHVIANTLERAKLIRENERYKKHLEEEVQRRTRALQNEIAERRRTEGQLKRSLEEKEALLKEVHHRVKNNLQIISSLLRLQQQHIGDPEARRAFSDSQNRVRTMALVHDLLYRSAEVSRISAKEYLSGIVNTLMSSESGAASVDCNVQVADLELKIDVAIPCGLVLNELTTNALRHAFPPGASAPKEGRKIWVAFTGAPEGAGIAARLTIEDNGKGLPEGFDMKNTSSLGLQLVLSLVTQLEGTIETAPSGRGARLVITFPLP